MTVSKARAKLGDILLRVIKGEEIGLVHSGSGRIVELRAVEVVAADRVLKPFTKEEARAAYGTPNREFDALEKHATKHARLRRPDFT